MAIFRFLRHCGRTKVLLSMAVTGVILVLLQKYTFSIMKTHRTSYQSALQRLPGVKSAPIKFRKEYPSNFNQTGVQSILMHTFPYFYEFNSGTERFISCDHKCTLTLDEGLLDEVDAVIIYSHGFHSTLPLHRSSNQIWAFFAVESPTNSHNAIFQNSPNRGFFNWTMTYRRDSDLYFGYGDVVKSKTPLPTSDLAKVVAGKSKLAAWFVSNCNSKSRREEFTKNLQRYVQVDVFGRCGPLECGSEGDGSCMDMLSKDYYFYMALENSICNDYLTEKIYRTLKKVDIVPVVRGGANYSKVLPPNSFIDASKFPTGQELAEYLKKVAGDKELYLSYLSWKKYWTVFEPCPFPACELCRMLHHKEDYANTYKNIDEWWVKDQCHNPAWFS